MVRSKGARGVRSSRTFAKALRQSFRTAESDLEKSHHRHERETIESTKNEHARAPAAVDTAQFEEVLPKEVFLRGVPVGASEDVIKEILSVFGRITRIFLVRAKDTGLFNGSVFVVYRSAASAQRALDASSVVIQGASVQVFAPLSKQDAAAATAAAEKDTRREQRAAADPRNLHLAAEGYIPPDSEAAAGLPKGMLEVLKTRFNAKMTLLKNPNYCVSAERLSVRNLPSNIDERQLRDLVMNSLRSARNTPKLRHADILRQVKIVTDEQRGVSRGFGFVQFRDAVDALNVLRALNNNPTVLPGGRRLHVEFAVDNVRAVQKLQKVFVQGDGSSRRWRREQRLLQPEEAQQNRKHASSVSRDAAQDRHRSRGGVKHRRR